MKKLSMLTVKVVLLIVLIISVTACSSPNDKTDNNKNNTQNENSENNNEIKDKENDSGNNNNSNNDTNEEVEKERNVSDIDGNAAPIYDPIGKYDPTIKVTTIHTGNDGAFWFPEGDSIEENIYTRRWNETLGIDYEFVWTSPGSQAEEKMNIMMASGDLPDVFSVTRNQFERLYKSGSIEDITGEIADYASKYTKKYLTGDYAMIMKAATKEDKVYGIPNAFSYQDNSNMVWIRSDWLDNLNLELPETLEELEVIMDAFVHEDPDMNNQDDTYAIALGDANMASWDWGINPAYWNMFHVYPNQWIKNSAGNLEEGMFGQEQVDKTRKAILKLKEYYNEGYINQDFATFDNTQYQEELFRDRCGVIFGGVWEAYWPLVLHKDSNPEADWVPVNIPTSDGEMAKTNNTVASIMNINVVRKGYEHPEALVKMSNLFHQLNNNPETMEFTEYNTQEDGNQIFLAYPLLIYNPSFNYEGFLAISEAFEKDDPSNLCEAYRSFYDQAVSFKENNDKNGFPAYRSYTDNGSMAVIHNNITNKLMMFNEYTDQPTEYMIDNAPTVKKIYDEMFLQIVMGEDIEKFDEFMESYNKLYGKTASEEIDEWFEEKDKESIQDWFENN